jgi:hypothetical protein
LDSIPATASVRVALHDVRLNFATSAAILDQATAA